VGQRRPQLALGDRRMPAGHGQGPGEHFFLEFERCVGEQDEPDRGGVQLVARAYLGPVGRGLRAQEALDEHHLVLLPDGQVHAAVRGLRYAERRVVIPAI
jgi:hypothetical protein